MVCDLPVSAQCVCPHQPKPTSKAKPKAPFTSLFLLKTIQVFLMLLLLLLPSRKNFFVSPLVLFAFGKKCDVPLVHFFLGCHQRFGPFDPLLIVSASTVASLAVRGPWWTEQNDCHRYYQKSDHYTYHDILGVCSRIISVRFHSLRSGPCLGWGRWRNEIIWERSKSFVFVQHPTCAIRIRFSYLQP